VYRQVWRPHLVKDIEIYEKVQRRATRVIEECKGKDYRERLRVDGLITLERRLRADLLEVFKILMEGV
jgi:ribonucleases P/MRP protein subunit RPP40